MKTLIIALCIALSNVNADIVDARNMFLASYNDEHSARRFYEALHTAKHENTVLAGYRGVSEIMMCPHVSNPFSKLAYFNRGKQLLETAIFAAQQNVELRYLRFTVQTNIPKILCYSGNVQGDKDALIRYLQDKEQCIADEVLYKMVKSYMLKSTMVNENEKAAIRQAYAGIQ